MNSLKIAFCSFGSAGIEGQYTSWEKEGGAKMRNRRGERMVESCIFVVFFFWLARGCVVL